MRLASSKTEAARQGFLNDVRRLATRAMTGLARTRITPNTVTAVGVLLTIGASVFVYFSYRHELAFFWAAAGLFVIGSILDILDGALARASGKVSPLGAFIDSTTDRIGEAFMLGAVVLVGRLVGTLLSGPWLVLVGGLGFLVFGVLGVLTTASMTAPIPAASVSLFMPFS